MSSNLKSPCTKLKPFFLTRLQTPPLSNSTLRHDVADWSFEGNVDSEKERVMQVVRNATTKRTSFENILESGEICELSVLNVLR